MIIRFFVDENYVLYFFCYLIYKNNYSKKKRRNFRKISNNDFTPESVHFINIIILHVKSSTLQRKERRQFTFIKRFILLFFLSIILFKKKNNDNLHL